MLPFGHRQKNGKKRRIAAKGKWATDAGRRWAALPPTHPHLPATAAKAEANGREGNHFIAVAVVVVVVIVVVVVFFISCRLAGYLLSLPSSRTTDLM